MAPAPDEVTPGASFPGRFLETRDVVAVLCLVALVEAGTTWLAGHVEKPLLGIHAGLELTALARIMEIPLILAWMWGRGGNPVTGGLNRIGLGRAGLARGLRHGVAWCLGFGLMVMLAGAVLALAGAAPLRMIRVRLPVSPTERALFLVVGGLIGPVAEELVFRGVIFGCCRRWGLPAALFLSSAIFLVAHPAGGWIQVVGGVLFALAYETSGHLSAPILIHVAGNLALFGLSLFF